MVVMQLAIKCKLPALQTSLIMAIIGLAGQSDLCLEGTRTKKRKREKPPPPNLFLHRALRAGSLACSKPGIFPANEMHPTIALSASIHVESGGSYTSYK